MSSCYNLAGLSGGVPSSRDAVGAFSGMLDVGCVVSYLDITGQCAIFPSHVPGKGWRVSGWCSRYQLETDDTIDQSIYFPSTPWTIKINIQTLIWKSHITAVRYNASGPCRTLSSGMPDKGVLHGLELLHLTCLVTFSNKCLDIDFDDPGCVGDIYFDLWCYVKFKHKHNIFEKSDPVLHFNLHAKASNRLLVGLWLHLSALLSWLIVFSDFMFAVIPFNRLLLLFLRISCKVLWHNEAVLLYSLIVRDSGNDFENVSLYNDHCQITVITSRVPMCYPCEAA